MSDDYEYRQRPSDPTVVEVRHAYTKSQAGYRRPPWKVYMCCDSAADAERILWLLEHEHSGVQP